MYRQRLSSWSGQWLVLALALMLGAGIAERASAQTEPNLESTIFKYDGRDFVRVHTTLRTEGGKSAVNTKLSHAAPAYEALIHKRSYSGNVILFGRKYEAHYAPLTDEGGRLTGALFVAVPR